MSHRPLALALALALAGCAAGPDFRKPPPPEVKAYLASEPKAGDQRLLAGAEVPARWWELFRSPRLNALVDKALAANPGVAAAEAALRAAHEGALAQRGAFWPQVGLSLAPSRQRSADSLNSPLNSPANPYSLHTAQVTVAYVPDVFGANRRAVESLEAQAEASRLQLEAARLALAANVVAAVVQEATLEGQFAAQEEMVRYAGEALALARKQRALGAVPEAAVAVQEAAQAQARANLPPLRKQLSQTRDLLLALTGGFPDQELAAFELDGLELPPELPLSLPAKLVERRPDVRAAEAQAHAAAAQVGVALAARLPQFSLSAGMGSVAATLGTLFQGGGGFWSLAGAVAQPVFQGGALMHRQKAAEATLDQALAQYRATVIGAFQNVADTLNALDQDAQALAAVQASEQAARRSRDFARRQVELGDISRYDALMMEQNWQQARMALAQARANRYLDTAALFQALGGGWSKD